jgi:hypothetical protein
MMLPKITLGAASCEVYTHVKGVAGHGADVFWVGGQKAYASGARCDVIR